MEKTALCIVVPNEAIQLAFSSSATMGETRKKRSHCHSESEILLGLMEPQNPEVHGIFILPAMTDEEGDFIGIFFSTRTAFWPEYI